MSNCLKDQILKNLPFTPTKSQNSAAKMLVEYLTDTTAYSVFLLRGYAGTGKTQLIASLVKTFLSIGTDFELLAPTGRAAKVLTSYTGCQAYTIHRKIYQASVSMLEEGGAYHIRHNRHQGTVFIVDESSMIGEKKTDYTSFGSGSLLNDLFSYVYETDSCRLIFVGDSAQLPPVGSDISPALDASLLRDLYGFQVCEVVLTDVVRQQRESMSLSLATHLRQQLFASPQKLDLSKAKGVGNVAHISGADLVDSLDTSYRKVGQEETLVITYSNKRALAYNLGIRSQVLYYEEKLVKGDRLVVTRNNYHYCTRPDKSDFLANGEIIEICHLGRQYEFYGFKFADATIKLVEQEREVDVRLILDALDSDTNGLSPTQRQTLYDAVLEDYISIQSIVERRKKVREDAFYSSLEVKYAYALTCHKAQGGQWKHVYIDMEMLSYLPHDKQLCRWLYTAVTRVSEQLFLINTPIDLL